MIDEEGIDLVTAGREVVGDPHEILDHHRDLFETERNLTLGWHGSWQVRVALARGGEPANLVDPKRTNPCAHFNRGDATFTHGEHEVPGAQA